MTPEEKRSETYRLKRERRQKDLDARMEAEHDREKGLAICRSIRDAEGSSDADKLEAIRLIILMNE